MQGVGALAGRRAIRQVHQRLTAMVYLLPGMLDIYPTA